MKRSANKIFCGASSNNVDLSGSNKTVIYFTLSTTE
jgi:hypothetical protein